MVTRRLLWAPLSWVGLLLVAVATVGLAGVVTVVATVIALIYLAFFLRHALFALSALRLAGVDLDAPIIEPPTWPTVSVLVPCRNEEAVVGPLVSALAGLDYPADRVEFILIDDASTDRTADLLDAWAAAADRRRCVHRLPGSGGGKSGALNAGLKQVTGEVVVVFDADHRPRSDVLKRLLRHFVDPSVAAAQGRCQISNPDDSPLTHLVAIDYLAGYYVNEYGRQAVFGLPAYGGANCAVRTSVVRSLGGWNTSTVTEDTDLTLRVVLAGYHVRYDITAVDYEEGVVTLRRYWRQRYRWSRGHQQAWREFRRPVWASGRLSLAQKVESTMFLFAFHLPVVSAVSLLIVALWFAGVQPPLNLSTLYAFSLLMFVGPLIELATGLLLSRAQPAEARVVVFFLPLFFVSVALCTKAWLDGLFGRSYAWVKTQRAGDAASAAPPPVGVP
jgi:cellulose synthase/poly-beta-1,6-N-acetylglucosamine synthase-like glycosyltransferase